MIYIVPTANKPIKVVYENPSCTVELDGDDLIIKRPLTETEKEDLFELLKKVKAGTYQVLTDGKHIYEVNEELK